MEGRRRASALACGAGGVAAEEYGREQGMGIKSALILNYSRDKNSSLKRSSSPWASPSSLVQFFLKARELVCLKQQRWLSPLQLFTFI